MREKEAYNNKWNIIYFGEMFFEMFFQGNLVDFRFMMFSKVLMKDLARILIHVHKIFNCRVSFKMLLSVCLVIPEKTL